MAMISLTWIYKSPYKLFACGLDAEQVERFIGYITNGDHPMPFVFSKEEIRHFNQLAEPEKGFCAAYCSKEAFFKAVSLPYNFNECELYFSDEASWQTLKLSDDIKKKFGILSAEVKLEFFEYPFQECIAAVYLFKDHGSQ